MPNTCLLSDSAWDVSKWSLFLLVHIVPYLSVTEQTLLSHNAVFIYIYKNPRIHWSHILFQCFESP
jgi:hypothetical protein